MGIFDVLNGIASVLGLAFSMLAAYQAKKASVAARQARDAVVLRTLADELEGICVRAEQLVDFLVHRRTAEAWLRVGELTSLLSEVRQRRSPYLAIEHANSLLTAREQLTSVGDAIQGDHRGGSGTPNLILITVSRRVVTTLREVLGVVKSKAESEKAK
jgi:hypothetical protein